MQIVIFAGNVVLLDQIHFLVDTSYLRNADHGLHCDLIGCKKAKFSATLHHVVLVCRTRTNIAFFLPECPAVLQNM